MYLQATCYSRLHSTILLIILYTLKNILFLSIVYTSFKSRLHLQNHPDDKCFSVFFCWARSNILLQCLYIFMFHYSWISTCYMKIKFWNHCLCIFVSLSKEKRGAEGIKLKYCTVTTSEIWALHFNSYVQWSPKVRLFSFYSVSETCMNKYCWPFWAKSFVFVCRIL